MKLHASHNPTPANYKAGQACRKIHSWHLQKAERTFKFQISSPSAIALPAATFSVVPATSNSFFFFPSLFIITSPFQQAFARQLFHKSYLLFHFVLTGLNITSAGCHRKQLATAAPCRAALTPQKEPEEQDISETGGISGQDKGTPGGHSLGRVWGRCRTLWWSKERKETFLK